MNFTILQKVIPRVYTYVIVKGCERVLLKELFFLFVILKPFFGQPKGEGMAYVESLLKEQ